MTVSVNPLSAQSGRLVIKIVGVASAANAGIGQVANPEGVDLQILRSQLFVKTHSSGAANLSVGVVASGAAGTDVVNALAMGGAIDGKIYNASTIEPTAKTELTAPAKWATDKFITFTGSASTAGLEAYLLVEYLRLP